MNGQTPVIRTSKVRFAIGFYLLSGWLPWAPHGEPFGSPPASLSLCGAESGLRPARWIICCGHTLSRDEGEAWIAAGLGAEGPPDRYGRRTLIRGPALQRWINDAWHALRAARWSAVKARPSISPAES